MIAACSGSGGSAASDYDERIEALRSSMEALYAAQPDAGPEALEALLAASGELEETGVDETGAWGRFPDGRLVFLVDDRETTPSVVGAAIGGLTADPPPYDVPGSARAELYGTMGNAFGTSGPAIRDMLISKAYTADRRVGTVEELRAVDGPGVFFYESHGGLARLRGGAVVYALGTASKINRPDTLLWAPDIDDHSLAAMIAKQDLKPNGTCCTVEKHYAITAKFVEKYMRFAPDSFVYVDACNSFEPSMMQAFFAKGASFYTGWRGASYDASMRAARYLFDRLLGANQFEPESPPQRPFNWPMSVANLLARGYDRVGRSTLHFAQAPDTPAAHGFGLLAPSLTRATLGGDGDKLGLFGSLGWTPAKATLGGAELTCALWYPDAAWCDVERTGPFSIGDLVVSVDGRPSNPRRITEWKGTLTFTGAYTCGGGPRNLSASMRLDLRFRADVGDYREAPGATLIIAPVNGNVESNTTNTVDITGRCNYPVPGGTETEVWSGTGTFPLDSGQNYVVIDRERRRIALHLYFDTTGAPTSYVIYCPDGTRCASGTKDFIWQVGDGGFQDREDPIAGPVIDIAMDDVWSGVAGSRQGPTPSDPDEPWVNLTWTALTATSTPSANAAR
ncbi:hypothetical protein L6R52_25960 [Myxococcota bacterium]|nr:hypothetical protein [Myxococcota bacterium]